MFSRIKQWNDETRERNIARAARMNAWMDLHGPNAFTVRGAEARAVAAAMADPEVVTSYAGLTVYPDRIVRQTSAAPLEEQPIEGVTASVVTGGNVTSRATFTRAATLGGGWQKQVDHREAQIVVDGPTFQWIVPLRVDQVDAARQLAATITTVGRRAAVR